MKEVRMRKLVMNKKIGIFSILAALVLFFTSCETKELIIKDWENIEQYTMESESEKPDKKIFSSKKDLDKITKYINSAFKASEKVYGNEGNTIKDIELTYINKDKKDHIYLREYNGDFYFVREGYGSWKTNNEIVQKLLFELVD